MSWSSQIGPARSRTGMPTGRIRVLGHVPDWVIAVDRCDTREPDGRPQPE